MKFFIGSPLTPMEWIQAALVCFCVVIALVRPGLAAGFFAGAEKRLAAIADRPVLSLFTAGFLPLIIRGALLPIYPVPTPSVHDEYGFLLLADTFASGRITNPTPAMWRHFESIYILLRPTYTAQYQIAQGLLLGAAQFLTGSPWWGVFVSMGVLCALLVWMLRAWLSPKWALAGGILAVFQFGVLSYWMNSYFGGAVPAIGGTLVLGALPRLKKGRRMQDAIILAVGFVILINSRPLEGFLLFLVAFGVAVFWPLTPKDLVRIVLPIAAVLLAAMAFLGYYNRRVTGNATELPYSLYQKTYGTPQSFWWQPPVPMPPIQHKEIRDEYLQQFSLHERRTSWKAMALGTAGKAATFWRFYVTPAMTLPLFFLPWTWRERNMGLVAAAVIVLGLDYLTFFAFLPQYAAPITGAIFLIVLLCLRRLRQWQWQGRPTGLFLSRALPIVCVLALIIPVAGKALEPELPASMARIWSTEFAPKLYRAIIEENLLRMGGRHLVICHYRPDHSVDTEWVYNGHDIANAPIIWAREMDEESNRQLIAQYPGRTVWLADVDANPPHLTRLVLNAREENPSR